MKTDAFERLLPQRDDVNDGYWAGLDDGDFLLQRCDEDGSLRFPPSPVCPNCLSSKSSWQSSTGTGAVWSWIVMHQRYFEAYDDERPYIVAFIELDDGPSMMAAIRGDLDALRIGARVHVEIERIGEHAVPVFRLED